jgi:phosphatidylserine/phosphatidylglycerophosphate/cardiolipin synthase-like enzyme
VTEVATLNVAALAAARRSVYIEAQYLAAAPIADRLALLLERADGPEIVLVVWHQATGWLERFAMGSNRDRLLRRLAAADRHGRLRAYWLRVPGESGPEINLHAKLMIVDDVFLRIGSSNLNNRSLGYDTECDLAIEGADEATRSRIAEARNRLLAEHLVRPPDEVARAVAEAGLIAAIERLNHGGGRFQPYRIEPDAGPKEPFPGTGLLDPAEPLDLDYLRRWLQHLLVAD